MHHHNDKSKHTNDLPSPAVTERFGFVTADLVLQSFKRHGGFNGCTSSPSSHLDVLARSASSIRETLIHAATSWIALMTCFMMQIGREIQAKATHTPNDMGPSETENKQTKHRQVF